MNCKRTLSPAAAPLTWGDLLNGVRGLLRGGRQRAELEQELKEYFGVKHVFCVNSGKTALTLILRALQTLSPKKEVVLPAYTCFSVPSAVLRAGLRPRLCDVDERTFDFKFDDLKRVVGPDTLCVLPCHLFGIPADVPRVQAVCRERGVTVVEDAAQAMGVAHNNRLLGTIGEAGFYSLGRGKMITCGEGGIIVTNSDQLAHAIGQEYAALPEPSIAHTAVDLVKTCLMLLLIRPTLYWIPASLPFLKLGQTFFDTAFPMTRLSGGNAGLMRSWRSRLKQSVESRREAAREYQQAVTLSEPSVKPLPFLRLPVLVASRSDRDALMERAQRKGVGLSLMYPGTLNDIKEVRNEKEEYPGAQAIVNRLVTLPTHQYVSHRDKLDICALIANRLERSGAGQFQTVRG